MGSTYEVIEQGLLKKPSVVGVAGFEPATKGL